MDNSMPAKRGLYSLSPVEALQELGSRVGGLSSAEAESRLALYGRNALSETKPDSVARIFLRQFANPVIYMLLGAASIVLALGHKVDAAIILAVLTINAIVGSIQEGRAQNTLAALRKMVRTDAIVLRDSTETVIPSEDVVPGDILVLKEGDKVPADARVIEAQSLKADESALTGESEPVLKATEAIEEQSLPAHEQKNMVFGGTYVVGGEARAVVAATGLRSAIGEISQKLEGLDTDVPLKAGVKKLSRIIIATVLVVCSAIFAIGMARGIPISDMFVTAVAVAVSATPEGLPVVVTIVLAAGMYRMSKQNALVRKLQAVEALGQAKVIAVDKTGTITLNQMAVEKLWTGGTMFDVDAEGYRPEGAIRGPEGQIEPLDHADILLAGKISALAAGAAVAYDESGKEWKRVSGDPTEAALLVLSRKIGFDKAALEREHPRMVDIPFSSATRYRGSVNRSGERSSMFVIGAPETVFDRCVSMQKGGKAAKMAAEDRLAIEDALLSMSSLGLRVVALAVSASGVDAATLQGLPELSFVGLAGISDSIRSDARSALDKAHEAGVRVVMITGDHPGTAKAIAEKVGIYRDGDRVLTGAEVRSLPDSVLAEALSDTAVFARVAPEDKLKIIEAYRKRGDIVAMTGDGVNDALSLAAADLGVAMGKIGTEVAKEAADIVLVDDNFGSIVSAIEEGRNVYRSIKKVILYLLSTSIGEVLTIASAMILGLPIPLLASQIIWMNFVTDGFLVVSLALEPRERKLLSRGARKASLIDSLMVGRISLISPVMAATALFLFASYLDRGFAFASTIALTALTVCQWYNAFNCRTEAHTVFGKRSLRNPYLFMALAIVICLQLAALYTAPLQAILHTVPIGLEDWLVIAGAGLSVIVVEEIRKLVSRSRREGLAR